MARLLVQRRYEASTVVGGVLSTLVDPEEFPDLGSGLWWAVQTVTRSGTAT